MAFCMSSIFQFGESLPKYPVRVLNEREARAGAGIFFFLAIVAFMHVWLNGNFAMTQFVVITFFVDFFVRVLINPKFAPSLVLGRIAVRNQTPEYVGAPQKRFAWALGLVLAAVMFFMIVVGDTRGPVTMLICITCLFLLFFETSFGICLGCMIYNAFNKEKAKLCPGGVCEIQDRQAIQKVSAAQLAVLMLVAAGLWGTMKFLITSTTTHTPQLHSPAFSSPAAVGDTERCKVPEFAKAMGHEDKWKLHNNC
jgi:Domain of unknown function (DUF4395)